MDDFDSKGIVAAGGGMTFVYVEELFRDTDGGGGLENDAVPDGMVDVGR